MVYNEENHRLKNATLNSLYKELNDMNKFKTGDMVTFNDEGLNDLKCHDAIYIRGVKKDDYFRVISVFPSDSSVKIMLSNGYTFWTLNNFIHHKHGQMCLPFKYMEGI